MALRGNFEYDTAYPFCNQLDLPTLATAIDNDGADEFFGSNNEELLQVIKQEVMSPFSQMLETESNENSNSEYMTPMTNNIDPQYEFGEDKENISKTHVNRQLILGNDSPNETIKAALPATPQIDNLNFAMKAMQLSGKKLTASARKSVKFVDKPAEKVHVMETRLDTVVNTPTIVLRSRSVIRKSQACFSPAPEPESKNKESEHSSEASKDVEDTLATKGSKETGPSSVQATVEDTIQETSVDQPPKPPMNLRSVPFVVPDKVTAPQPFKRPKRQESPLAALPKATRYIPMAEVLYKFHKSTPNRFHTIPRGSMKISCATSNTALKTTVPQSPALLAKSRSRPVHYPTQEEKEEEELKEINSHKVTALPFNPKVFKTPKLGKPIEKRKATEVEPFHLTEVRKMERARTPKFNFSARPIPKGILNGVTGVGEKATPKLTDPVAPSFEQRRLAAAKRRAAVIAEKGDEKVMSERAIFHFGIPNSDQRRKTEVVPFSFHERDKQMQERKEQKIKQFLEEERKKAEFHANPIPRTIAGSTVVLNNNAVLPNVPVMSMFMNDGYKERRENLIKAKKHEEEELLKKMAVFKARPATVVRSRPFEVKKIEPLPLEVEPFDFNTERRAKEWEVIENDRKAKETELKELRKQREVERAQKEAEEVAKIRNERVHRANPLPKLKPFSIKTSDKELTVPVTPFRQ